MKFARRAPTTDEESDSYFVSMTDMMVGVIFVFIIMLSFFALQYRSNTAKLVQAKDAQTSMLLRTATKLERQDASLEIDREHHVVCIPAWLLVGDDNGRRCFAYSATVASADPKITSDQARKTVVSFIGTDLAGTPAQVSTEAGSVSYPAEQLFEPGTATLSGRGRDIARTLAASLATRLPCYGYGAPEPGGCTGAKMSVVNIMASASFDAFTETGRASAALALNRSVIVHDALIADQPVLGRLSNAPSGQAGAQPLLRVASFGQSQQAAPAAGQGQTISVQFQMLSATAGQQP